MHQFFASFKQLFRRSVLLLAMLSLLSGLFFTQPSYAATTQKLPEFEKMHKQSAVVEGDAVDREQAYEQQVKAEKDPNKVYKENLKEERQANQGEGIVEKAVEGAKDVVNKVTGK